DFYVCWRPTQRGDAVDKCCQHTAIFGSVSGNIYEGWTGPPMGKPPQAIGQPGWKCKRLTVSTSAGGGVMNWGPNAGTSCAGATSAQIVSCIQAHPAPGAPINGPKPGVYNNCQTDSQNTINGCCLTGYTGLGLGPRPFAPSI